MPCICMHPSPVMTITGAAGRASLAPMPAGIAQPIGPIAVAERYCPGANACQ